MATTYTLSQIRTRAKEESDNVNSAFVSDPEWLDYINASYFELYGLITEQFGNDYFSKVPTPYSFVTDGTNQFFALPSDFYKLLGVDLQVASPLQWISLKRFNFADRNQFSVFNGPIPQAGQTIRVWYIPSLTPLAGDSDTVDGVNGWEEYIVIDAAMKAMAKEESDVSVLFARKKMMLDRVASEANNRDAGNPQTIVDVMGKRARAMQYRLSGNQLWVIGNSQPGFTGGGGDWFDGTSFGYW